MVTERKWFFVTSHAVVLIQVAQSPDATVREIAEHAALTERQTHRVLADLVEEGYVSRSRVGRRNTYRIDAQRPMKHPAVKGSVVGDLLSALTPKP
jgi:DNA-binding MarR family transcriptional regulator